MLKPWLLLLTLISVQVQAGSLTDETILVDGKARRFLVHDFSNGQSAPVIILLHGGGGSGDNMASQTGFDTVAEREGLIAVYPYGSSANFDNILLTWNAGHCCSYAMRQDIDDVHFISALIDHVIASRTADAERVYVTGLSNGGMMTHRLGRELPNRIAAIAPVISSNFGDEPVREFAMPTLIINGANDQTVLVQGGELGLSLLGGLINGGNTADKPTLPVAQQSEYWAKINGCSTQSQMTTADYALQTYAGCRVGGAVQRYLVNNNGHAWPGGTAPRDDAAQPTQAVSANELIWAFFKQYRRQSLAAEGQTAFYYDEHLSIPTFSANGQRYTAQLHLVPLSATEFELQRLEQLPSSGGSESNRFDLGVLTLATVAVVEANYRATFTLSNSNPIRLRLQMLQKLTP